MRIRLGGFAGVGRSLDLFLQRVRLGDRRRGARRRTFSEKGLSRVVLGLALALVGLLSDSCRTSYPLGSSISSRQAAERYERKLIQRSNGTRLECYVSKPLPKQAGAVPLIFMCQGSGYGSVFEGLPMGGYIDIYGWFWEFGTFGDRIRLAFVEKRGVAKGTPLLEPGEADPPMEFRIHDTLEERVDDVLLALQNLINDPSIDRTRIALAGFGEGAQVAAAAARRSPYVTHLGFFACGGESHLNELLSLNRDELMRSDVSPEEAEEKTDDLIEEIAEVFAGPADVETLFGGVSYAHVMSYWLKPPLEDLLALDIPIYVAFGNMDRFVPPESVDRIRVSFLKAGKTNLTLTVLPGLDHGFASLAYEGEDPSLLYQTPKIFDSFTEWFLGSDQLK